MTTSSQFVHSTHSSLKKVKRYRISHLTMAVQKGEYTLYQSGLHYVTVCEFMKAAHRICGWEPDSRGRYLMRVYMWGPGSDVKNVRLSAAERQAKKRKELQTQLTPVRT